MNSIESHPFFRVPLDVMFHIASFLIAFKYLATFSRVCSRFYHIINDDQNGWKYACISWWEEKKRTVRIMNTYRLEFLRDEAKLLDNTKDWLWFAKCFSNHRVSGSN
jgi:hypothetical protein